MCRFTPESLPTALPLPARDAVRLYALPSSNCSCHSVALSSPHAVAAIEPVRSMSTKLTTNFPTPFPTNRFVGFVARWLTITSSFNGCPSMLASRFLMFIASLLRGNLCTAWTKSSFWFWSVKACRVAAAEVGLDCMVLWPTAGLPVSSPCIRLSLRASMSSASVWFRTLRT